MGLRGEKLIKIKIKINRRGKFKEEVNLIKIQMKTVLVFI
jgi:hypothetical protein